MQDLLGIKKIGSFSSTKENVDEDILTVICRKEFRKTSRSISPIWNAQVGSGPLGTVEIDLMQPLDPAASPKVPLS